ncbi:MAG: tyrosine recombinase [Paracoccus sp. (in: a-proteobacteria)]|nr:tyrosine recombinase [Paracoccus sp. (in: a-proteobacteria)]
MAEDRPARQLIATFLDAQSAENGAARNTILAYGRDLRDFADWLAARQIALIAVSREDIEDYLRACDAQGLSRATRARRLSSIRQFTRFALSEGLREDDPAIRLEGPGRAARLPRTLSRAEMTALFEALPRIGRDETEKLRAACVIELLYATGMRVSELVSLPVAPMRGDPQVLLIRGKGGRERMVPLGTPARRATALWLAHRDGAAKDSPLGRLIAGPGGRFLFPAPGRAGHLNRQAVNLLIRDLALAARLDPARVTPHVIRHAFATHLLEGGADLRSIQTLLGHADLSSTEIYTHVLDARMRDLVLNHHPLARVAPDNPPHSPPDAPQNKAETT